MGVLQRGSIMGFFISFVKNDNNINKNFNQLPNKSRITRGKKSIQFLKGTTRDLF